MHRDVEGRSRNGCWTPGVPLPPAVLQGPPRKSGAPPGLGAAPPTPHLWDGGREQRSPGGIWTVSLGNSEEKGLCEQIPEQISWHLKEKGTLTSFEGRFEETAPPILRWGGYWGPGGAWVPGQGCTLPWAPPR